MRRIFALILLSALVVLHPGPGQADNVGEDTGILLGLSGTELMYSASAGAVVGVLAASVSGAPLLAAGAGILGTIFVAHLAIDAVIVGSAAIGSMYYLWQERQQESSETAAVQPASRASARR